MYPDLISFFEDSVAKFDLMFDDLQLLKGIGLLFFADATVRRDQIDAMNTAGKPIGKAGVWSYQNLKLNNEKRIYDSLVTLLRIYIQYIYKCP